MLKLRGEKTLSCPENCVCTWEDLLYTCNECYDGFAKIGDECKKCENCQECINRDD